MIKQRAGFLRPPRMIVKNRPMPFNKEWQEVGPKSVLQPLHTLPLLIKRFFTDVNGTVISKNDAGIPVAMKTKYPVFFLGDFDKMGSFRTGLKVVPPLAGYQFLKVFVNGNGSTYADVVGYNGFADIQTQLEPGDIVLVYCDSVVAPTYFVWFAIQGTYNAMSSVIGNTVSNQQDGRLGTLYVDQINYYVDSNSLQIYEPLNFTRMYNDGTFRNDSVNPSMFKTPFNKLRNFITLSTNFEIDQYLGINFYMNFEADSIQMDLILKKIN